MMLGRWEISCNALWHISTPLTQSYVFGILTFRVFSNLFANYLGLLIDWSSHTTHIQAVREKWWIMWSSGFLRKRSINLSRIGQSSSIEALWSFQSNFKTPIDRHLTLSISLWEVLHLPVKLEHRPLWTMKLLNMDPSLVAWERKYQLLQLDEYSFHAYKSARLYKEIGNDAKVVGKFMQCVLTHFDAPHSVLCVRHTHLQSVF